MTIDEIRKRLGAVLSHHAEVELAVLFGSRARNAARSRSDVDLAVVGGSIDALGLAAELSDAAGAPVDIVNISMDPPIVLLLAVLRDGIKIHEGRPGVFGRFLSHSLMDLETDLPSFRHMQRAFVDRVAKRGILGEGLGVMHLQLIARKLADLDARVTRVRAHRRVSAEALAAASDAIDLVAFNLMLAVQAACDLASLLIADEGWTTPATVAGCFDQLAQHKVIMPATAAALRRAVAYRNLVAHGYAGVEVAATHAASTAGVDDLDRFARELGAWLTSRPGWKDGAT